MPATMTKAKSKKTAKDTKNVRLITDAEIEKARKLAGRSKGVTRLQLAESLKIPVSRAARILERAKFQSRPLGQGGGKANRSLVFYTYPPI